MLRLYLDEDSVRHSLVEALRVRGVDVSTAIEARMTGRSDLDQLGHATAQGRTLCTFNVADFYRLHGELIARGQSHAGIVLMTQQRYSVGDLMRRLLAIVAAESSDSMRDRAAFLSAWEPRR